MKEKLISGAFKIILVVIIMLYVTAKILHSNNGEERKEMLYYELINLNLPQETKVERLVSYLYVGGDCNLECDLYTPDLRDSLEKKGWKPVKATEKYCFYKKSGTDVILYVENVGEKKYTLNFVDCRYDIISSIYNLPRL